MAKSVCVWLVSEIGWEYSKPIKVWQTKQEAELHMKRLEETKDSRSLGIGFLNYHIERVPMQVTKSIMII